jgi:hypothetical protein
VKLGLGLDVIVIHFLGGCFHDVCVRTIAVTVIVAELELLMGGDR